MLADVHCLPIATGSVNALHAGGIVPHLADPERALREWAQVARCRKLRRRIRLQ
ncbi:MAG: class I SAM-dependent methyltransferase [Candidatus Accumulibacter phosphatis]|nr:class I SAM-dependent methyltransferase [Candidatus Accumulibacter phosphatis]